MDSSDLARTAIVVAFTIISSSCISEKKEVNQASGNLRIISYNVWYGFSKVPERKQTWIEWMIEQQPDVASLQELNGYTGQLLAEDARRYGHAYSALLKEEGFPTGITSRYPIEDIRRYTEGFHHGLMRVRIQGIYFYVIHLHPSDWETRMAEINRILQDIENLPTGSGVILAGDFNTFSPLDSLYYAHGRLVHFFHERDSLYKENNLRNGQLEYSVIQEVMNSGLIDLEARMRDSSHIFQGSFPTLVLKEGEDGDQRRLDYVFASGNLLTKVIDAKIIASDTTFILSDHLPVVVDLDPEQ